MFIATSQSVWLEGYCVFQAVNYVHQVICDYCAKPSRAMHHGIFAMMRNAMMGRPKKTADKKYQLLSSWGVDAIDDVPRCSTSLVLGTSGCWHSLSGWPLLDSPCRFGVLAPCCIAAIRRRLYHHTPPNAMLYPSRLTVLTAEPKTSTDSPMSSQSLTTPALTSRFSGSGESHAAQVQMPNTCAAN